MNKIYLGRRDKTFSVELYFSQLRHLSKEGKNIDIIARETAHFLIENSINFGEYNIINGTDCNSYFQKLNARELSRFNFSLLSQLLNGEQN
ncbi:hypothetical protein J4456_01890 [Candidatus Pacearchaeota archaeon]|nr:hypothetical protein [Candidatus Pacearchaeota archaeon]